MPAIFLLILASIFVLLIVVSLPMQFERIRDIDTSTPEGAGEMFGSVASLVVWLVMNLAIVLGAIAMIRSKSYGLAYTAAIFSVIPVCSPCFVLGIPFGIWALIGLSRPDVKKRFRTDPETAWR
ncbi:MAG TPA: hypothetical protein VHC22_34060 [Pirellulales bacterium]|nr:hypothetical protein [Pirellulales bacterium]